MELHVITTSLIEDCLRAWRQGKELSATIYDLDILKEASATQPHHSKDDLLYQMFESQVLEKLYYYRKLMEVDTGSERPNRRDLLDKQIQADFEAQNMNLDEWSALYYRYFEPDYLLSTDEIAHVSGADRSTFRRRLASGIIALTEEIRKKESIIHRSYHVSYLVSQLDTPEYSRLFGVTGQLARLEVLLGNEGGPNIISIEGIGGIGKTAVARELANRIATSHPHSWIDFLWISARQEWFNERGELTSRNDAAKSLDDVLEQINTKLGFSNWNRFSTERKLTNLTPILSANPYLIFIDNLETIDESILLVQQLPHLAGKSRFVLTSRETLRYFDYVHCETVPELSPKDAELLINTEINRLNPRRRLTENEVLLIYETIGGIPLALKLIASQLRELPVQTIIPDLKKIRDTNKTEVMFEHIYRRTWSLLSRTTRLLLLAMYDIDPNGASLEYLRMLGLSSGLSDSEFGNALKQMYDHSLLEASGLSESLEYRLHRLTITFLQTNIISVKWQ